MKTWLIWASDLFERWPFRLLESDKHDDCRSKISFLSSDEWSNQGDRSRQEFFNMMLHVSWAQRKFSIVKIQESVAVILSMTGEIEKIVESVSNHSHILMIPKQKKTDDLVQWQSWSFMTQEKQNAVDHVNGQSRNWVNQRTITAARNWGQETSNHSDDETPNEEMHVRKACSHVTYAMSKWVAFKRW